MVTGPGLPASGGGADGASAGLLLASGGFGGDFYVASPPYAGVSTPTHTRAAEHGRMYVWQDGEIAALPSENLAYSVTFYDDHGTPATSPTTWPSPPIPSRC